MKKKVAEAWVKDLRTPGLNQAKSCLFDGEGYCCLGRLALVVGATFKEKKVCSGLTAGKVYYRAVLNGQEQSLSAVLEEPIMEAAGIRNCTGYNKEDEVSLASLNDGGATFSEIADYIEENWEDL